MKMRKLPELSYLHACLHLDDNLILRWKTRPIDHFADSRACNTWNTRFSGKVAAIKNTYGRFYSRINWIAYHSHRIIYAIYYGVDPGESLVDHIDGNHSNNHPINLRLANYPENGANQKRSKRNTSGVKNVYFCNSRKKWRVRVTVNGVTHCGGFFENIADAAIYAKILRENLQGSFATLRGNVI